MPTISQLPAATLVSAGDKVPVSQEGTARAISIGALLASTQPEIIIDSPSLLGRASLGSGGPEQVGVGTGINLSRGTLVADGSDHAIFPVVSNLSLESDVIVSHQGTPMRMQASLLRGLFSAGHNVAIDPDGVISSSAAGTVSGSINAGSPISALPVTTALSSDDLVPMSHSGSDYAVTYGTLLGGVTIDQAQVAGPAGDSDTIWVAQGSNIMASQNFSAIWVWIAKKLATYRAPVVEVTTNTSLDATVHNGRLLICSQPVVLNPLTNNMGNGFQCTVINASSGIVVLGSGFISSNGLLALAPWQSATLSCATYSAGTIAFAYMPPAAVASTLPGQVTGVVSSAVISTAITVSWQPPLSGGVASWYIVQFRQTGTTSWSSSAPVANGTTYQLTSLQPATSYDIAVAAQNVIGLGAASAPLTAATSTAAPVSVPTQVVGVVASATSTSDIQLSWNTPSGA